MGQSRSLRQEVRKRTDSPEAFVGAGTGQAAQIGKEVRRTARKAHIGGGKAIAQYQGGKGQALARISGFRERVNTQLTGQGKEPLKKAPTGTSRNRKIIGRKILKSLRSVPDTADEAKVSGTAGERFKARKNLKGILKMGAERISIKNALKFGPKIAKAGAKGLGKGLVGGVVASIAEEKVGNLGKRAGKATAKHIMDAFDKRKK